jgi:hypothetical protein
VSQKEAKLVLDYLTLPYAREHVERATVWVGLGSPDLTDKQAFLRGLTEALACLPKLVALKLPLGGLQDCNHNLLGSVLTNGTLTTLTLYVDVRMEVSRPLARHCSLTNGYHSAPGQPKA